jgi:hypothetical protein
MNKHSGNTVHGGTRHEPERGTGFDLDQDLRGQSYR